MARLLFLTTFLFSFFPKKQEMDICLLTFFFFFFSHPPLRGIRRESRASATPHCNPFYFLYRSRSMAFVMQVSGIVSIFPSEPLSAQSRRVLPSQVELLEQSQTRWPPAIPGAGSVQVFSRKGKLFLLGQNYFCPYYYFFFPHKVPEIIFTGQGMLYLGCSQHPRTGSQSLYESPRDGSR